MSDRMKVAFRNLCLAGVALMPVAAIAQAPAAAPVTTASAVAPAASAPIAPPPAAAAPVQETVVVPGQRQVISTGVAAIVNDYVISDYDLDQRVALFVATSGIRTTPETLAQIRTQVLRSLQDEVLELQEASKHKISVTKAEVDKALQNIAMENRITLAEVVATVVRAGVTEDVFRQQVAAQLTWQKLVGARYGTDIVVNDSQVDEMLQRLRQGADKPQYLLSEIFMAVDRPEDEAVVKTSAEQIVAQVRTGAPFGTVATQFSQSPSAADGGDIGWVLQGQLAEDLDKSLGELMPGEVAGPIRSEGGYYILQLRDRREPLGTKIETAEAKPVDPTAPIPLDRLLIPLPANPPDEIKDRAMALASNVSNSVRSCADLPGVAGQLQGSVYTKLGQMKPSELAEDLRDRLLKTAAGGIVEPFFSPAGLELIMRCDPAPVRRVAFELPSRDELTQQLFVQQMSVLGRSYLRDLRRDAVVETR